MRLKTIRFRRAICTPAPAESAVRTLFLLLVLVAAACSEAPDTTSAAASNAPIQVVVTLPPLAWVVTRAVGTDLAEVSVLLPEGASPHGWEPSPSDILTLRDADLVLVAGAEDLRQVQSAQLPESCAVMSLDDDAHDHVGDAHAHAHSTHPWLNREKMTRFYLAVGLELGLIPEPDIEVVFMSQLLDLEPNGPLLVLSGHNAWSGFFEPMTGDVLALRHDHHDEPSPATLARVRKRALDAENVLIVFEPGVDDPWLRDLAEEVGAATVTLDPVGTRDWLGDMHKRYDAVIAALESLE